MKSLDSTHLDENGNPSLRYVALGESLSGQLLGNLEQIEDLQEYVFEQNERENFGVQQMPLFNLLKPEELDWPVFLL